MTNTSQVFYNIKFKVENLTIKFGQRYNWLQTLEASKYPVDIFPPFFL